MASLLIRYGGELDDLADAAESWLSRRGFTVAVEEEDEGRLLAAEKRGWWRAAAGATRRLELELFCDEEDEDCLAGEIRTAGWLPALLAPLAAAAALLALFALLGWRGLLWLPVLLVPLQLLAPLWSLVLARRLRARLEEFDEGEGEDEEDEETEEEGEEDDEEESPAPRVEPPRKIVAPRRANLTAQWPAGAEDSADAQRAFATARQDLEARRERGQVTPEEYERRAAKIIVGRQVQEKLEELEYWRQSGLISEQEYEQKRREIIARGQQAGR